jgi:hypothetical protein
MSRLILHVGLPKTGSKLIQRALKEAQGPLAERGMAALARAGYEGLADRAPVRWRNGRAPVEVHREVGQEIAARHLAGDGCVVSHEDLLGRPWTFQLPNGIYPHAEEILSAILDGARPDEVKVTIYLRRPDRWLEAMYLQSLRMGNAQTFEDYTADLDPMRLSWLRLVHKIERATGSTPRVRYFETIKDGSRPYVESFFDELDLGVRPALDFPTEGQNRGYSEVAMRIAQAANPLLDQQGKKALRRFLDNNFTNVDYPRPSVLTDERRAWLLSELTDDLNELHRGYVAADDDGTSPYLPDADRSA